MSWAGTFGLLLVLTSLAVIPGPSDLLVAASAVRRGYGSAVRITLGVLAADLIFILAVVLGANALMVVLDAYAHWLNWLSAGVLILMGLWMLRSRELRSEKVLAGREPPRPVGAPLLSKQEGSSDVHTLSRFSVTSAELNPAGTAPRSYGFAAGFMVTFCDPKALAFYFGVLPTFFDLPSFGVIEVAILLLLVSSVICMTKAFYAWIAVCGWKRLPGQRAQSYLLKIVGLGLIAAGAWRAEL